MVYAISVPIHRKESGFRIIEPSVPFHFINFIFGRGNYALLEHILGRYHHYIKYGEHQDPDGEYTRGIDLLVPEIGTPLDENVVRGAMKDVFFEGKMIEMTVLDAVTSLSFTIQGGHWWLKYGLPMMILAFAPLSGYAYGSWTDIILALYLMKGRGYFVEKSLENQYKDYSKQVKKGIRATYKTDKPIIRELDENLQALKREIDEFDNKTEAYIWALHNCRRYGYPELRTFYSHNSALEEWDHEEVGVGFKTFTKDPIERSEWSFRETLVPYEPETNRQIYYDQIFEVEDRMGNKRGSKKCLI